MTLFKIYLFTTPIILCRGINTELMRQRDLVRWLQQDSKDFKDSLCPPRRRNRGASRVKERIVQTREYSPNGLCFEPMTVTVSANVSNSKIASAVHEVAKKLCECPKAAGCLSTCKARSCGFTNLRLKKKQGIVSKGLWVERVGGNNLFSQLEHDPESFTAGEVHFRGYLRDVTSWKQFYEGSIPIRLEYDHDSLSPMQSVVPWASVRPKPTKVRMWDDFVINASNYFPPKVSGRFLRIQQRPASMQKDEENEQQGVKNGIGSEYALYDPLEKYFFESLTNEQDIPCIFQHFIAKKQVKFKNIRSRKEVDFAFMCEDTIALSIEVKTVASLIIENFLQHAKEFFEEGAALNKENSPFGQIYQYMTLSKSKYGVVSNYDWTLFLRVGDDDGKLVLEISKPIRFDSREPYIHQSFHYVLSLIEEAPKLWTKEGEKLLFSTFPYGNYGATLHPRPMTNGRRSKRGRSRD